MGIIFICLFVCYFTVEEKYSVRAGELLNESALFFVALLLFGSQTTLLMLDFYVSKQMLSLCV